MDGDIHCSDSQTATTEDHQLGMGHSDLLGIEKAPPDCSNGA